MKKCASFLLLAFFSLTGPLLQAQTPYFQEYHPSRKRQPVEVHALLQDSKGFLWIGTDQGLFRFDGIRYVHYTVADSLPDIHVTALAEDSLGRIWLGHRTGEISFLHHGAISRFETREGSAVEAVSDILFDKNGRMWFSTLNDGLYYYVEDRLFRLDGEEGLPDEFIYDLYEDATGRIWAGTDGGIAVCSLEGRDATIEVIGVEEGLPDIIIRKIESLEGDTVILATEDAGVIKYNARDGKIEPLLDQPWRYGSITDLLVKENQLWIASPSKGLVLFDRRTHRVRVVSAFEGQSLRSVQALLKDFEGNIWAGSRTGLYRTLGDAVEHIEKLEPCTDPNILALTIDAKDRIWFSSPQGLFVRAVTDEGGATVRRVLEGSPFEEATVISLYADGNDFVWAGLYGNGLLRIDVQTGRLTHFSDELRNGNVLSITGSEKMLWLATLGGGTAIVKNGGDYTFTNYSSGDGLSSDFIYQVFVDSRERVWFATDGKGVSMLDHEGFHHFDQGLGSKVVYGFAEDHAGDIWVSSQGSGVYRFAGDRFETVEGLSLRDTDVQSMAADDLGNLVMTHNFGIDVFDIRKQKMRYWGEETGIRDKHPNLNAVTGDRYGRFYVGTTRGIVKVSLSNDTAMVIPRPAIEAVRIYDEIVDLAAAGPLQHNENNITIQYLGFWYQNAENLQYLYKLENYDLEWIHTRNQEVTYSRLPPGEYVFKVKVSDTDDFSHSPERSVAFSISPPFWRTSTFYVFVVGIFVISAYGLMKFRERRLLEDKLILEARVEERTREIQIKTEEIQAQNEEILAQAEEIQGINENLEMLVKQRTAELEKKNHALEEYAFINAHKLRGPVASILGLLNLLMKSNPRGEAKVVCEHLQQSAEKLDDVVRSITKAIEKADNKFS